MSTNVVPISGEAPVQTALEVPKHFKKAQKAAWTDLIESTDKALHVKQHRFTFEIAAMLLAKMRGGQAMTATESKELKKHMIALGLATNDEDQGKPPRKNAKYFGSPAG